MFAVAEASEIEKKDVMTPALAQTDEKSKSQSKKVSKLYMFPLIKRRLSATKFEEFERVRRIKEAEEKLENEEHEKRQGELKSRCCLQDCLVILSKRLVACIIAIEIKVEFVGYRP